MPQNMPPDANDWDAEPYEKENFCGNGRIFPLLRKFCPVTREIYFRHKGFLGGKQRDFRSGIREFRDKKGGSFTTIGTEIFLPRHEISPI